MLLKKHLILLFCILLLTLTQCKKEETIQKTLTPISDGEVPDSLKINQLQYLGSHNSYRLHTDEDIFAFLVNIQGGLPAAFNPTELDYTHLPLQEQFTYYGIRQIELDVYLDNNGGLFYNRKGYDFVGKNLASGIAELQQPGIKILHIPDIDFNTNYYTLKAALNDIKNWSNDYPNHLPIFILLELGSNSIDPYLPNAGFVSIESWNNTQALQTLENEILDVFEKTDLITPDDVRGNYATLNEAVLNNNWPTIGESRGKIMFLHNNDDITSLYTNGAPNLENKVIFTNSTEGADDAAFIMVNNVLNNETYIAQLAAQGYIIRTRVDSGTDEARNNDYSKWHAALNSGAHFLSTDYYKADSRAGDGTWTDFHVQFNNKLYRINPITTP